MDDQAFPQKFVGAVEAATAILRHLAGDCAPRGVAAIARATELNVSTTFNILRTLCKERLATFDPVAKTYRLGLGILDLSVPLLGVNQVDLLRPVLEELSSDHRILIGLWLITPSERIVLLDRVVPDEIVRADMALGSRLPAFVGAVGRCYAATLGLTRAELQARFDTLRWDRPPAFKTYAADVAEACRIGYARDFGHLFRSLDIVAAVIVDHNGRGRFGISGITIAGQHNHDELERVGMAIRDAADRVSRQMFGKVVSRGVEPQVIDTAMGTGTGAVRQHASQSKSRRRAANGAQH